MNDNESQGRIPAGQSDVSTIRLLLAVPVAALKAVVGKLPPAAVSGILTLCGLILILSPLLLWVSWTIAIFNSVLGLATVALIIAFCLITFSREDHL